MNNRNSFTTIFLQIFSLIINLIKSSKFFFHCMTDSNILHFILENEKDILD